jgi:Tol biopolymer transport system component
MLRLSSAKSLLGAQRISLTVSLLLIAWAVPIAALEVAPPNCPVDDPSLEVEGEGDASSADADSTEKESTDDWDVNEPRGEHTMLEFTVDEGTWMSVDVSPDGKEVIFDLLGDLYRVSMSGGEATRLTSGMAWDHQPRYSPDGTEILFTSDRGGGSNLWILPADGGDPEEMTDAGEKNTNCGAWSPDGQWIVAKRRLTDASSIGTTELWMYHRRGGDGIQVTKKDALPEVSEPVFHPDGRFLYFSSRSSRFRYNRNPYQGIFQIRRFDRKNGNISPVTSRFGGGGRPTISPDGNTLLFITRDANETVLMAHDLINGSEREVFRGLDHDLQESFAWAGVYPAMDFTPDGQDVVLWYGGKLHRVNVESGESTDIPFSCDVSVPAQPAVRSTADIASETFTPRVLRWMHAHDANSPIVFAALGSIYEADADGSSPKVLLRKDDDADFEYAPRLSPNGKRLAYVSWNDADKGQVFVARSNGSGAQQISQVAGQWVNPTWSANGKQLLALKGSGASLRGSGLGNEMYHEIWRFDLGSKTASYVMSVPSRGSAVRMPTPSFSPDGGRIRFLRDAEKNQVELVSVALDGTDERVLVSVKYGEEFAISPNGQWVAYKRLHDAYVAPMPLPGTGKLELGDSDGSVKVYKLTEMVADWIRWEDNETITWAEANELHRQTLTNLFAAEQKKKADAAKKEAEEKAAADELADAGDADAAIEEAEEEEDEFAAAVITIDLSVPRAKPSGAVVLENARIITMEGDEVIENGTIVIEGNRITQVGRAADISLPISVDKVMDLRGKTVMPGLIDAHAHMGYSSMDVLPQRDWQYYANLAYGVTATMDPSASTHLVFAQSEMVEAGIMKGPRIYSTGFILYGADIQGRAPTKSFEDALRHVQRMKKMGAFAIKSYMQPKRIQRQWFVEACRREEMLNFPEGGGNFENNMGMILDGHTGIEHTVPVAPLYADVRNMWSKTKVGYTPTFLVAYGGISGEEWFYQHDAPIWADPKLTRFTPKAVVESRSRRLNMHAYDGDYFHMKVAESANELQKMGVMVNLGAHGQRQGLGCHWDLWALSQGGTSNHDVLRAGTISPAAYIGLDSQMGSVKEGKLADLIVLDGNPLDDIRNTNTVHWTIKNGEVFDAATMDELYPEKIERGVFVWEE